MRPERAINFTLGSIRINLELTSVYLSGPAPVRQRFSQVTQRVGTDASRATVVRLFSIPSHVIEELWLSELPQMVEQTHFAYARNKVSKSIVTLMFLLETADPEFVGPSQGGYCLTSGAALKAENDVWVDIWRPCGSTSHYPRRCAWLNLDRSPQTALISPRPPRSQSGDAAAALEFKIADGEGITWDPSCLKVCEVVSRSPCAKMILSV